MTAPPIMSDSDILAKLRDVIAEDWHDLPDKGYGGTGGPGMYLETLLGLETKQFRHSRHGQVGAEIS